MQRCRWLACQKKEWIKWVCSGVSSASSGMARGLKSSWKCAKEDFVHVTIPSVDSIILSQHIFPPLEPRYLWQLLYLAIPHIDASVAEIELRSRWCFGRYISFSLKYANIYPLLCFILIMLYVITHDGARNLPQINMSPILSTIHSSEQTITHCDCSDYVAYTHHKEVKFWSMFYYSQVLLGPD